MACGDKVTIKHVHDGALLVNMVYIFNEVHAYMETETYCHITIRH